MSSEYPEIIITFEKDRRRTQPVIYDLKSQSTSESLLRPKQPDFDTLDWDKILNSPLNLKSPARSPSRSPAFLKSPNSPYLSYSPSSPRFPSSPNLKNKPRVSKTSKTLVLKAKPSTLKPVQRIIHSKSDQPSISEEVTGEQEIQKIKETLTHTKLSLTQIRENAKICYESSKNLLVNSKKKQKNYIMMTETQAVSQSFNLEAQRSILRQLTSSINMLSDRVSTHEEKHFESEALENLIKSQLNHLKYKIDSIKQKNPSKSKQLENSGCKLF